MGLYKAGLARIASADMTPYALVNRAFVMTSAILRTLPFATTGMESLEVS